MVRRPMVVDDSTNDDVDEDELELIEGAAAGAGAPSAAGGTATAPEAGPAADKRKSVRLAADGEDTNITCCDAVSSSRPAVASVAALGPVAV